MNVYFCYKKKDHCRYYLSRLNIILERECFVRLDFIFQYITQHISIIHFNFLPSLTSFLYLLDICYWFYFPSFSISYWSILNFPNISSRGLVHVQSWCSASKRFYHYSKSYICFCGGIPGIKHCLKSFIDLRTLKKDL